MQALENKIINQEVANLKEFGYDNVIHENILTDAVYSQFFKSMLEDNKGKSTEADLVIDGLLAKIPSL